MTKIQSQQKKRIVLVHPRGFNWFPGKTRYYGYCQPHGAAGTLSIAAYLIKQGHDVFVYDCLGPEAPFELQKQTQAILAYGPQIVGFSTTTSSFPDAADLAQKIKEQSPDIMTVCGGVHVSALQGKLLQDYPAFDFLVVGEGELTIAELASGIAPADIKGLIWRKGERM